MSKHNLTKRIEELYNNYLALKMELDDSDERIAELEKQINSFTCWLEEQEEVVADLALEWANFKKPFPKDALSPPEPEPAAEEPGKAVEARP
jgi:chromosome segregation ATPase